MMFDMNMLFEEFIVEFMKRKKQDIDNLIEKVTSQSRREYLFKENNFQLKPDIIVDYKEKERIIIDTKYKKLDSSKKYN
jgi:5-methylcytosine-specific restriction enzyme subunit McrC